MTFSARSNTSFLFAISSTSFLMSTGAAEKILSSVPDICTHPKTRSVFVSSQEEEGEATHLTDEDSKRGEDSLVVDLGAEVVPSVDAQVPEAR